MDGTALPTLEDVRRAAATIAEHVHRTPVLRSRTLDERTGLEIHLKAEHLQRVGAFKMRGATNAIAALGASARDRGVVTHSSGNHAQAVALAARRLGVRATVVMPRGAAAPKRAATEGYGARIVPCDDTQASREATVARLVEAEGALLVHPYDDPRIVAGAGTAALELLEQTGELDAIVAPVGGGGLLSGTAVVAAAHGVRVVGAEPRGADDAARSLETGERVTEQTPDTICDGLRTCLGALPFRVLRHHSIEIVRVSDEETLEALRLLLERVKAVVEPSAAVALAALLAGRIDLPPGSRVGVILSGGNLDVDPLLAALGEPARSPRAG